LWYLPFVHVSWTWLLPEAEVRAVRRRGRLHEEINARHRDAIGQVVRRFDVGDIFGLTSMSFNQAETRPVSLLPWIGSLRQMHVVRGMAGGTDISHPEGPPEGDPFDMRRYVQGDPIRYVLWKVFAKTRDLVVREPERAISPSRQTVAYLVASEGDDPAAGAARVAVDVGAFGGEWTLGADGCGEVADNKDKALEVLTQSARATEAQSGAGLGSFLDKASKGTVGRAVVFVPPKPGPWLDRVLKAIRGMSAHSAQIEFLVGTDGVRRPPSRSWWRRLLFGRKRLAAADEAARQADAEDLAAVVRKLGGTRLRVLVVDRPAGLVFGPSHLRKLGV